MNRSWLARGFVAGLVLVFISAVLPTLAQGDVWREGFDDPTMPGWERSSGVAVVDGLLRMEGAGFAFHGGEWADLVLRVRIRLTGDSSLVLSFRASDGRANHLVIGPGFLTLQREQDGGVSEIATAVPVAVPTDQWFEVGITALGDAHTIALNGDPVLDAREEDALPPGGIGLEVLGGTVEIDDLSVLVGGEAGQPAQQIPPEATDLAWIRTGGPPGGLGYDIRYNFSDPNVWYVTDNFAGVHISYDNGHTWQPSNAGISAQLGPTGDWRPIFSLTVDPHNPQIIWAGTDVTGHIYRSTDAGKTWEPRDNGIANEWDELTFRGFTIDPRSSDIVYAMGESSIVALGGHKIWSLGDGGVVYRTADGGEHWSKIWDGGIPSALARYMWIDPDNPDTLYVSTGIYDRGAVGQSEDYHTDPDPWGGLGILKSTDGGQTWRILGMENGLEGLYIGSLYMHPQNPEILLAAVGHEMGFAQIDRLRQEGQSPAGIYRTSDGGEVWNHVYEPPVERVYEEFSAVEFCASDPNIAYAGSALAIYRSEDAGLTWTKTTPGDNWGPPGVRAGWPIDLQCDPRNTNRLFANNYQGGAFLSEDGGRTWINASQGYTGAQMFNIAVDPRDPARVYVIGRSGGWRSDDGGTIWQGLRNFTPGEPQPILAEWGTIALNPANPDQVWASDGDGPVIIESQNRGASWTLHVPPEGVQGTVLSYAFTAADPNVMYAGYGDLGCLRSDAPCAPTGGVIVSEDRGQTWRLSADEALLQATIAELAVDPGNPQIVYAAAAESGLYKTMDGGTTWAQIDLSTLSNPTVLDPDMLIAPQRVQAVAIDPANSQHLLIGVQFLGIFASNDGGQTWQAAYAGLEPNGSIHDIVFDPINPQVAYASDRASGVYRSADSGQTWLRFNAGLNNRAAMWLAITVDGQHLYVSTDGEGVYRLDVNGLPPVPAD